MAGGSGTRLWPLSRSGFPKQFLVLGHDSQSLFQQAVARLVALGGSGVAVARPVVVGNEEHRFMVLDQLRDMRAEPQAVILEPVGRNTAPAVTLAALQALEAGVDPVMVVTSADQTVTDQAAFSAALRRAVAAAGDGAVVILGIAPDKPETGYGYIRADGPKVAQFVEKPDLATAQKYLAQGGYYWNAGMFVLKASVWMAALERFRPDIAAACRTAFAGRSTDAAFVRPDKAAFAAVPAESVDYAVLEKCPGVLDIRMEPLAAGWNDLGAWDAVWQVTPKDAAGNAQVGDAIVQDCRNTLVHATSRLVSVIGLDDVVVVETPDAVLVARRERSQDVKNVVTHLGREQRGEHALHRKVHRPWGWYDSIDQGPRDQVKRIMVKPGASLSLQMHHHRAEHWIVVTGTAEVTVGDKLILLAENQSTYIPLGEKHRLRNPGKVPLELIEVQSGSYLGEDDIVRFEDTYGRVST
ncbi:MAG: mannose-1-phosphate guanylyltransferase/mannose-6-phosphate isomerase [Ideonella sp. WA131b]|jgi:mannose-1-phosphate guanylyltransferase/mannose-6-phosphate isomerase|nr:mannose-1-phosphate guanylyltransferase/mannose-6-phosphate isomerase [Ideonella sp. WA131b]